MFYLIKSKVIEGNKRKTAIIISKTNLVFLNLFGRNQLNKTTVEKISPIKIFMPKSSSGTNMSAVVKMIHSKRKYAFIKLNNIFNVINEYLTNIVTIYYKMEV